MHILQKVFGLQGNEEREPMCAKLAPIILGMIVALQHTFDHKCELSERNVHLNIPLRLYSAVSVST
jgi:hypothetical protein